MVLSSSHLELMESIGVLMLIPMNSYLEQELEEAVQQNANAEFGNFLVPISHRRRHQCPSSTHRGNHIIPSQLFYSNFGS